MRAALLGVAIAIATATATPAVPAAPAPSSSALANRGITLSAEAYPAAPTAGLNATELGARPATSRLVISNPPASSYARAAVTDNGALELYTGPPPAATVAECDTDTANIPEVAVEAPIGTKLEAHCTAGLAADAAAAVSEGAFGPVVLSTASSGVHAAPAAASMDALTAAIEAAAEDVLLGPLQIASVRAVATAVATGEPGGASGAGSVTIAGATVAGIPVRVDANGVVVDTALVPLDFVTPATQAVRDALAASGYFDVRLAQPLVTLSEDTRSVTVSGGGLFVRAGQPGGYFAQVIIAGGVIRLAVGEPIDTPLDEGAGTAAPEPPPVVVADDRDPFEPPVALPAPSTPAGPGRAGNTESLRVVITRSERELPEPWGGWPWLLAGALAVVVVGALARRRVATMWTAVAERFVRG